MIDTPLDLLEHAFAPLVQRGTIRDPAVALILPGHDVIHFPATESDDRRTKLYEVGSLTKPMTAELLASMIIDGKAAMSTRIGDVLSHAKLPTTIGDITLEELATHQSGLARLPSSARFDLGARFTDDPYRWLSEEALIRSLASASRATPRGTYSNFGFAVLGRALAVLDGATYDDALAARILRQLALENTYVAADDSLARRFMQGHNAKGKPTSRWHTRSIAAAGGVSMTISNATRWLAAHLAPPVHFREIVDLVTRPRAAMDSGQIGLGWIISQMDGKPLIWHNGGTGGFSSFAAFDPANGIGIVALAASAHVNELDAAGVGVLRECALRRSEWS